MLESNAVTTPSNGITLGGKLRHQGARWLACAAPESPCATPKISCVYFHGQRHWLLLLYHGSSIDHKPRVDLPRHLTGIRRGFSARLQHVSNLISIIDHCLQYEHRRNNTCAQFGYPASSPLHAVHNLGITVKAASSRLCFADPRQHPLVAADTQTTQRHPSDSWIRPSGLSSKWATLAPLVVEVVCALPHLCEVSDSSTGRQKDGLYEPALAESEREAVAELLAYLENVCAHNHRNSADNLLFNSGQRQTSSPATLYVP